MTTTAHTPGPWQFDNYADHVSYFSDASKRKGDYDFRIEFPDDMPQGEAEANARLIAAAPDLYVALANFFNTLKDCNSRFSKKSLRHAMGIARAALECAKGGAI